MDSEGETVTSTSCFRAGALAALAAATLAIVLTPASAAPVQASNQVDIELIFDTSGSMALSIEQAKRDGETIIAQVKRLLPDARFAVASFRDYQNPAGEYELLQPLTSDPALVQAALNKLAVRQNTTPNNVPVELHNLALRRSYADP